jgi:hypothetical protein
MDYKKAYQDLLTSDRNSLRERIAFSVISPGLPFDPKNASAIADWIEGAFQPRQLSAKVKVKSSRGVKPGTKRGPYKKAKSISVLLRKAGKPTPTKRKYTKKAAYWKKKKK